MTGQLPPPNLTFANPHRPGALARPAAVVFVPRREARETEERIANCKLKSEKCKLKGRASSYCSALQFAFFNLQSPSVF
jgi:hypothetical protein